MPYVHVYRKPEFPPILPLGFKVVSIDELRHICVDGFSLSKRRDQIMCGLEHIIAILQASAICGRLWINGSFLTQKIDPDDSDVVLCMTSDFTDQMNRDQQEVVDWFCDPQGHLHKHLKCHGFAITRWPEGHVHHDVGEWNYAYWLRQWGFSRSDIPKGIAVVELP